MARVAITKRTAIFDLDGTLIDTADDLAAAMNYALLKAGLEEVPACEVRHLVGHGARAMLARGFEIAAGETASGETLDAGLVDFLGFYEKNIAIHSAPFEGALPMIEALRGDGWRIAICTNKRERLATLLLGKLELAAHFDIIVGSDTAAAPKPDAAPVHFCLERTGAERGVFFGDSDTDIRAAEAAHLPCLIFEGGYGPLTLQHRAHDCFANYREALAMLQRL